MGYKTWFLEKNKNLIIKIRKNVEEKLVFVCILCYIKSAILLLKMYIQHEEFCAFIVA